MCNTAQSGPRAPLSDDQFWNSDHLVDARQFDRVMAYIERGKAEGARLLTGGSRHGTKGWFVQPTIFADVRDEVCRAECSKPRGPELTRVVF